MNPARLWIETVLYSSFVCGSAWLAHAFVLCNKHTFCASGLHWWWQQSEVCIACALGPSLHLHYKCANTRAVLILGLLAESWSIFFSWQKSISSNITRFAVGKLKCLPKLRYWIYKKVFTKYRKECFCRVNLESTIPLVLFGVNGTTNWCDSGNTTLLVRPKTCLFRPTELGNNLKWHLTKTTWIKS